MDIPIQIPNGTHQIIIQIPSDTGLVYATLSLVIATLAGIIISGGLTVWSNSILIRELKQKYKPQFDFRERSGYGEATQSGDVWTFICKMYNVGRVSVHDIAIYATDYPTFVTIDEVIRNQGQIKSRLLERVGSTLEPEHEHAITVKLRNDVSKIDLRIVIWLEYEYAYGKEEGIAFLDEYANGQTGYTWFDNYYIQKRRIDMCRNLP